jgi:hypothetical protein
MNETPRFPVAASAILQKRFWRRRTLLVRVMNSEYLIAYDGWNSGGCVSITLENRLRNGARHQIHRYLGDYRDPWIAPSSELESQTSRHRGFVPQFRFTLESLPARLDVRSWPWRGLRGMSLRLSGTILYAEGCLSGSPDASASGDVWDADLDG